MKLTGRMSKWTSPKDVILKVGEGVEGVGLGGGCWKRGQLWEGGWSGVEWGGVGVAVGVAVVEGGRVAVVG